MKVLDYGAERKWQGLSALSVPLLPKPLIRQRRNGEVKAGSQRPSGFAHIGAEVEMRMKSPL